ncbi:MAG: hypothetical protein ACRD12_04555, partial [Acidimicrobiales bacterium]
SQYYVGVAPDNVVTIYRGSPGGFLWIEPEEVRRTTIRLDDVQPATVDALRSGVKEPSRADAERYVANLPQMTRPTTTTVPTTLPPGVPTAVTPTTVPVP